MPLEHLNAAFTENRSTSPDVIRGTVTDQVYLRGGGKGDRAGGVRSAIESAFDSEVRDLRAWEKDVRKGVEREFKDLKYIKAQYEGAKREVDEWKRQGDASDARTVSDQEQERKLDTMDYYAREVAVHCDEKYPGSNVSAEYEQLVNDMDDRGMSIKNRLRRLHVFVYKNVYCPHQVGHKFRDS